MVHADFADRVRQGAVATCGPVMFELLWAARDRQELAGRGRRLEALPHVPTGEAVWQRALDVFAALAGRDQLHHRQVPMPDLLIAAAAETAGLTVCHYDRDFDTIAEVTGQPVRAIAPFGSL